jgi:RNA polymerase sigma-70 factor (sigma-E family)
MNQLAGRQPAGRATAASALVATDAVTALYAEHALGLTRLAHVMLGDRATAEDVVQDAFAGLYRRWPHLTDHGKAQAYLRSAVLNGCRSAVRRAGRATPPVLVTVEHAPSAESALLDGQARGAVLAALRRLPVRQREALVLRYYLDLPDSEIAAAMSVGESTVRSTVYRGLAALERILSKELS